MAEASSIVLNFLPLMRSGSRVVHNGDDCVVRPQQGTSGALYLSCCSVGGNLGGGQRPLFAPLVLTHRLGYSIGVSPLGSRISIS